MPCSPRTTWASPSWRAWRPMPCASPTSRCCASPSIAADVVPALVLAAGFGTRLGGRKLELPWGETTLLEATLDLLRAAGVEDLLVVLGAEPERLEPACQRAGARTAVNPEPESGMLSSVQCGLRAPGD